MPLDQGVTRSGHGLIGRAWNVVGQSYTPMLHTESAFTWHAVLPADSFVPPHIHPEQDEWITVLTGEVTVEFEGETATAGPGDVVRMPRGGAHGIFNRSDAEVTCLFAVAPAGRLYELFERLDGVTDPEALVRISAEHDVEFLPPPQ